MRSDPRPWPRLVDGAPHDLQMQQSQLRNEVERWSSTRRAAEIVDRLTAVGVACEEVVSTTDALDRIRDDVSGVVADDHAVDGTRSPVVATPITFSATPARVGRAAKRGQHNDDVLADWLDDDVDLAALHASGALLNVRTGGGPHRAPLRAVP